MWTQTGTKGEHLVTMTAEVRVMLLGAMEPKDAREPPAVGGQGGLAESHPHAWPQKDPALQTTPGSQASSPQNCER